MDKVSTYMQIITNIQFLKDVGLIVKKTVKEKWYLKMEIFIKEILKIIK